MENRGLESRLALPEFSLTCREGCGRKVKWGMPAVFVGSRPHSAERQPRGSPITAILGISAFYHDSAAALVVDGEIVAAVQEERFTRKKHDHEFPANAIEYCLREGNLKPEELDYVGFYDKPFLKYERLLETYLAFAPSM